MTNYLSLADALQLVADLGVGPIRDLGLLESAVHRPQAAFFGTQLYPTIDHKAAALLESLVANHALVDGNKRLAWLATAVFYDLNGVDLDVDQTAAFRMVMAAAAGQLKGTKLVRELVALRSG